MRGARIVVDGQDAEHARELLKETGGSADPEAT
jgi:hypothetical protein